MATRLAGRCGYPADEPFRVTFHRERLDEPQQWKKPRRVFVCSMGDLWHPDVKPEDRAAVIRATNLAPQHTYLFLTKRPENFDGDWSGQDNFWLGVTVEDQQRADERIPWLLKCQARIRFLSCEPLLGPVEIFQWGCPHPAQTPRGIVLPPGALHWVIAGGETGPGARPANPSWFRSIRDQCSAAQVPFFFKGFGEWAEYTQVGADGWAWTGPRRGRLLGGPLDSCEFPSDYPWLSDSYVGPCMVRVGRRKSGCLLDGRQHKEFPE
jgi:protein gp37